MPNVASTSQLEFLQLRCEVRVVGEDTARLDSSIYVVDLLLGFHLLKQLSLRCVYKQSVNIAKLVVVIAAFVSSCRVLMR